MGAIAIPVVVVGIVILAAMAAIVFSPQAQRERAEATNEALRRINEKLAELRKGNKDRPYAPPTTDKPCPKLQKPVQTEPEPSKQREELPEPKPQLGPDIFLKPKPIEGPIELKCDPDWDECQKAQAREKIRRLNELAKQKKGLRRRVTAGRIRDTGNVWAAKFRSDFERICKGQDPSKFGFTAPGARGPNGSKEDFMHDCLYEMWRKALDCDSLLDDVSPDHIEDLQWGGHVQGPFAWLDREVNEKLGRDMKAGKNGLIDVATEFRLSCP